MKVYFIDLLLILFVSVLLMSCQPGQNNITNDVVPDSSIAEETITADDKKNKDGYVDIWAVYNYDEREGKRIFEHYCSVCHGAGGKGDGFNSYNLNPKPHSFTDSSYMSRLSGSYLKQVIKLGGESLNKSILMPAYGNTISDLETDRVISYIRTLAEKENK
jgi:cytochrome c oxidase cbb3-type subunit 3